MIEGGLGSAVHAPGRIGLDRRVGRDVDDHSGLSQNHRTDDGLDEPERADGVDLQRPLEVLAIGVGNKLQGYGTERARVVDQDVYRPGQGGRLPYNRIDALLIADVRDDSEGDPAPLPDLPDDLIKFLSASGDHRDFRAFGRKSQSQRAPQPPAPAGDED